MSTMFTSKPNLTQRVTFAVVGALWNQKEIHAILKNVWTSSRYIIPKWPTVEDKIAANIESLPLPMVSKKIMTNLIQPMGAEILNWMKWHFSWLKHVPEKFYWTERGAIDFYKTAKCLLGHKDIDVMDRYRLACRYCIEEEILALWPVIQTLIPVVTHTVFVKESKLFLYWTFLLRGELKEFMDLIANCGDRSPSESGFLVAMHCRYDCAVQFFLQKLDPARKTEVVLSAVTEYASRMDLPWNIWRLLLPFVCSEMQEELLASNSHRLLVSFITWPYQDFFMEFADKAWNTLSEVEYLVVLENLVMSISEFDRTDIYYNLFRDFWNVSPVRYKKYTISKCINETFLQTLFMHRKTDGLIKLIFEEVNVHEKWQMISCSGGMKICDWLIDFQRWESLQMFIQECIPSESNVERFKQNYQDHVRYTNQTLTFDDLNIFLDLLNALKKKFVIHM